MKRHEYTNAYGQRSGDCVHFNNRGRFGGCQLYKDWQEVNHPCVICKGLLCEEYKGSALSEARKAVAI